MGEIFTLENRTSGGGGGAPSGTGIVVQTGPATTVARTLQAGPGIDIDYGDGLTADPIIGLLEPISGAIVLAKFGLPFSSSSWSPSEFIGTSTASSSTPVATEAGGYVECESTSYIDQFVIKTQYTLGFDYNVELWQLDEFGNDTQALDYTSGLPIVITVPSGSVVGANTSDVFEMGARHTLMVRSDPSVGWNPGQAAVVARRRTSLLP